MMPLWAVLTRAMMPVGWISRRISGRIMKLGTVNALLIRNCRASCCRDFATVTNRGPV
jgi:hypothetical protein